MKKKIVLLGGDGIGPEITKQAVKVIHAVAYRFQHEFAIQEALMGATAIDSCGKALPSTTLLACKEADAVLLGAIGRPDFDHKTSGERPENGLLALRKELGLYTNIRPITIFPELLAHSPIKSERIANTNFVVFRELTGGIYFGKKTYEENTQTAIDECAYSVVEIKRIAYKAFETAQQRKKKLCLVDKANVLETSRLWRKVIADMASEFPDVHVDYMYVDNAAMQLILNPGQFDVILTENMFGDILTDEASILGGSIGLLPSASIGDEYALFEPAHGSYPQATGKNIANPIACILSVAMMFDYFNAKEEASVIRRAVERTIAQGILTPDLAEDRSYGTEMVGDIIAHYIESSEEHNIKLETLECNASTII